MGTHVQLVAEAARFAPEIVTWQHFDICHNICLFANELADAATAEWESSLGGLEAMELLRADVAAGRRRLVAVADGLYRAPSGARLPAARLTLTLRGARGSSCFFLLRGREDGAVVSQISAGREVLIGFIKPGAEIVGAVAEAAPLQDLLARPELAVADLGILELIALVLSLLNEPTVTTTVPSASRQERRAAGRSHGFEVDRWHRVVWDLSAERIACVSQRPAVQRMPLHFRRGHWRRAEQHYKGAVQRPDAFRREDRDPWWQWIDGLWVGHPAFGLKLSVHAPVMSADSLARRRP